MGTKILSTLLGTKIFGTLLDTKIFGTKILSTQIFSTLLCSKILDKKLLDKKILATVLGTKMFLFDTNFQNFCNKYAHKFGAKTFSTTILVYKDIHFGPNKSWALF